MPTLRWSLATIIVRRFVFNLRSKARLCQPIAFPGRRRRPNSFLVTVGLLNKNKAKDPVSVLPIMFARFVYSRIFVRIDERNIALFYFRLSTRLDRSRCLGRFVLFYFNYKHFNDLFVFTRTLQIVISKVIYGFYRILYDLRSLSPILMK